MSHKSLAIGTLVVLVSFIVLVTFFTTTSILQAINPIAALTALTVAIIGIAWLRKANN